MNNKTKFCLFLPLVSLLTSCALSGTVVGNNTEDKLVNLYSVVDENESINFEDYKVKEVDARIIKGQQEVLFLTLPTFVSLFDNRKVDGFTFNASNYEWTVTNKEGQLIYYFGIDAINHAFAVGGSLTDALKSESDLSKSSLMAGFLPTTEVIKEGQNIQGLSFHDMGFDYFFKNKQLYLPLSLLNNATSDETDLYYMYDYLGHIIQYDSQDTLNKKEFVEGENTFTINSKMKEYITTTLNNRVPEYIGREKKANTMFIFTNFYGLASTRNITDMRSYLNSQLYFDTISSSDPSISENSLGELVAALNDGHSSYSNECAWKQGEVNAVGPLWRERQTLFMSLLFQIATFYNNKGVKAGEPLYSEDGKMAFLPFTGFKFMYDAYNEDGSLKEEVYTSDTFFMLSRKLEEIKQKGGVEKIVLDISCNTGGTIGVLMKILTLISPNNSADTYEYSSALHHVIKYNSKVDTNMDGTYDLEDVYGDDFKFYFLTSPLSFSCGNALPFYAKYNGFAKILGVTSGGGECSVGMHMLPAGERIAHSSHNHIGWYDEQNGFFGDENGTPVDQPLMYNMFTDIETIKGAVNNL